MFDIKQSPAGCSLNDLGLPIHAHRLAEGIFTQKLEFSDDVRGCTRNTAPACGGGFTGEAIFGELSWRSKGHLRTSRNGYASQQ